jgi:hypothetical protein
MWIRVAGFPACTVQMMSTVEKVRLTQWSHGAG